MIFLLKFIFKILLLPLITQISENDFKPQIYETERVHDWAHSCKLQRSKSQIEPILTNI